MPVRKIEGISIRPFAASRTVKTPDGKTQTVTYRPGDPEFEDSFRTSKLQDAVSHRWSDIPMNFMADGVGKDGCPAHVFGTRLMKSFEQYHSGALDARAVEQEISDVIAEFRSTYVDMGYDPDEFMSKLLNDVYDSCKAYNVSGASSCSFSDSRALAAQYNGSDRNSRDVIYYDAKYYYQTEEMKTTLRESILRIAGRFGVKDLELSDTAPEADEAKRIYYSYNTVINEGARNDLLVGNMIDESMVPPRDFRFFYKGNESGTNIYSSQLIAGKDSDSLFDGVLHVWYGDWSFSGLVPVRMDATKYPVSVNMYDTVASSGKTIPSEIVPMLKNFDFFTVVQCGNYFKTHPRNLPY